MSSGSSAEARFANTPRAVHGLAAVGNFVLAANIPNSWADRFVFDRNGAVTDHDDMNYYSSEYAWDPVSSRVYFFRDGHSPNDLHYEVIDQITGQVTAEGETPYHGDYPFLPPIRVTSSGQHVLIGSGNIYNRDELTWSATLGAPIADARWFANNSLVTLTTGNNQTTLRRLGANMVTQEQLTYAGRALRVVGSDTRMAVLVNDNGTVQFHIYVPSEDSDNDGVTNSQDAFPTDPAASVDADRDGYPDSWNVGSGPNDSTTGLSLDAYPQDSACYLPAHGDGVNCDYGATIPNYVPDQVFNAGDTVYLLSVANRRVYRWSMTTQRYLNPYIVGIDEGFTVLASTKMAYSSAHQRLYLGYSTGAIRYIDVSSGSAAEVAFANTQIGLGGLAAVGNYVLAQDHSSGGWGTHYIFDRNGVVTDQQDMTYYSEDYAWDPVTSRVYFTRDFLSPNDLHYEVIDQTTGQITASGDTPYHGDYDVRQPIRVSANGQHVLVGSGNIFNQSDLTRSASLGKVIKDAHWQDDVLVDVDTTDLVEIRDATTRDVLWSDQYTGQPIRLVFGPTDAFLVHVTNNTTAFVRLPFGDQDNDSLPQWWEELYGFSDSNAADALSDPDGDGVGNEDEYRHHASPVLVDSDADGLTDHQEIVTYSTDPSRADTDGDGLSDAAEILTHHTNPLVSDTDGDNFSDRDEVLFGGDPNSSASQPQPLANYTQSFENSPDLAWWTTPEHSNADWSLDSIAANSGSTSLRSGTLARYQTSSIQFRGFFSAGQLSFYGRIDGLVCCDQLEVLVDGVQRLFMLPTYSWIRYSVSLTPGIHTIEWRYYREAAIARPTDSARIDDVVFVAQ